MWKEREFFFILKKEGGGDDGGVLRRLSARKEKKKGLMSKEHCEKSTASFSHSSCLYGAGVGG